MEIKCPECGGQLQYWKEYIVTKTQHITKAGVISREVKTSKPVEFNCNDMQGLECTKCNWTFNTVNDIKKIDEYPYLIKWVIEHEDELKV